MTISPATQFEIDQLRKKNLQTLLEILAVFIACFFVLALLPSLLVRYVYADAQLYEQPKIFDYIQVAGFAIGALYFIYGMIGNFLREKKIKMLQKAMPAVMDSSASVTAPKAMSMAATPARTRKATRRSR